MAYDSRHAHRIAFFLVAGLASLCGLAILGDAPPVRLDVGSNLYLARGAWQKPPVESGMVGHEWRAPVRLIRLRPDDSFQMIACWLIRTLAETGISPGDGQTIWLGNVVRDGEKLTVSYQMVMDIAGVVRNKPEKRASLVLKKGLLVFDGEIFDLTSSVDVSDFTAYIDEYHAEARRQAPQ